MWSYLWEGTSPFPQEKPDGDVPARGDHILDEFLSGHLTT
jgi:hypothetical protein